MNLVQSFRWKATKSTSEGRGRGGGWPERRCNLQDTEGDDLLLGTGPAGGRGQVVTTEHSASWTTCGRELIFTWTARDTNTRQKLILKINMIFKLPTNKFPCHHTTRQTSSPSLPLLSPTSSLLLPLSLPLRLHAFRHYVKWGPNLGRPRLSIKKD